MLSASLMAVLSIHLEELALAKRRASATTVSKSDAIREIIKQQPKATVKEIQTILHGRGIKASDALVSKIKYARKAGKKGAKRRGKSRGESGSKAEAIRVAWGELGYNARPRDIVAILAKRGMTVSSAQVSTLRKSLPRRNGALAASNVPFEHLLAAKSLAEQLGGVEVAKAALASLARLIN